MTIEKLHTRQGFARTRWMATGFGVVVLAVLVATLLARPVWEDEPVSLLDQPADPPPTSIERSEVPLDPPVRVTEPTTNSEPRTQSQPTMQTQPSTNTEPTNDRENELDVPLAARSGHTVTWTGTEVVVWGGDRDNAKYGPAFNDGAAFDPSTSRWRAIGTAPVGPTSFHRAVWTGEEIVFIGGRQDGRQVVAYDPAADVWSTRADLPFDVPWAIWTLNSAVAWTGERALVWHGAEGLAAYDPVADRWEEVDEPPVSSHDTVALHVDPRTDPATVVAVGGPEDQRGIDVAIGDAAGNWREGPGLDQLLGVDGTFLYFPLPHLTVLTDAGLLAISSGGPTIPAALWDLDGDWTELPPPPKPSCKDLSRPIAIPGGVVVGNYCGDGVVFDTNTLTFTPFTPAGRMGDDEAVWTGEELIAVTPSCCGATIRRVPRWRRGA